MILTVINRLKATAPGLTDVQAAEDLEAIGRGTAPKHGVTFVLPFRELAEKNEIATGGFRQLVHEQFLTAFVTRRHDDAKGGAKVLMFDALKHEIEQSLAGWAPFSGSELVSLVAGKAGSLGNNASIYVQTWQTTRTLRRS